MIRIFLVNIVYWSLCTISYAAKTQSALKSGAVSDRKLLAKLFLGPAGWFAIGCAAIILSIEFFQKRDGWILGFLMFGILTMIFLGKYFGS